MRQNTVPYLCYVENVGYKEVVSFLSTNMIKRRVKIRESKF